MIDAGAAVSSSSAEPASRAWVAAAGEIFEPATRATGTVADAVAVMAAARRLRISGRTRRTLEATVVRIATSACSFARCRWLAITSTESSTPTSNGTRTAATMRAGCAILTVRTQRRYTQEGDKAPWNTPAGAGARC